MLGLSSGSFLASSHNLTCFYILPRDFLPFFLYVLLSMLALCLAGPEHLSRSLENLLAFSLEPRFLLLILCLAALPIPLLPSYWPFSFSLDQSGALGQQSNTSLHHLKKAA